MGDAKFQKRVIFVNGLIPLVLLCSDWFRGKLGVNPVEFLIRSTGVLALVFLVLTLTVTPLRKIFGWNWLMKHRRMLGLFSFFYAVLHLATYVGLDRDWRLLSIGPDIIKRQFIAVGMLSFFFMIPLAITSTNKMIQRIGGKRWALLHRLTYAVVIGGVVHYYMIVKSDIRYPVAFGAVAAVLLSYRIGARFLDRKKTAR